MMDVILMGRKEAAVALSPLPLYIARTLASRHACGRTACDQLKLKSAESAAHVASPANLRNSGRMASGPGAVLVYCAVHCSCTEAGEKAQSSLGMAGMAGWSGAAHPSTVASGAVWASASAGVGGGAIGNEGGAEVVERLGGAAWAPPGPSGRWCPSRRARWN